MPRWFRRATPHPRSGLPVQLPGGNPRSLIDLVAVGEVLSGQRLSPEQPPPDLDEIRPRRSLWDEDMLNPGMLLQPLSDHDTLVGLQVVGYQVDKHLQDGPLYLL